MLRRADDVGTAPLARLVSSGGKPPRLLVVLAHPDDEVLAVGGRLERMRASRMLSVTDGAPADGADAWAHGFGSLQEYRDARRAELLAALALGGVPPSCAATLAVSTGQAARVLADQTAALHLPELTLAVVDEIQAFQPEAVLTHPYEGGHPDHDACAFAVRAASLLIGESERPILLESPFYHAGPSGIETGCFLPGNDVSLSAVNCDLSAEEQRRKRERLACFASQTETLAQFGVEREIFRLAPVYDFTMPPHEGRLFYENFTWGMSGARFRELAAGALAELGLSRTCCR